jgi:putative addiction module component (TIGR02574 family)
MSAINDIEKTIFSLPLDERAALAQRIWNSLEGFADAEIEKAWMDEADRRWQELENDEVRPIPAKEVMQRARSTLNKGFAPTHREES